MSTNAALAPNSLQYSIETLREEVRHLVERGVIRRTQPLYVLCEYLPAREWLGIECQLERYDYLLRDRIGDLIGEPRWESD
ncbi:DUF4327 family protein [Myxosarcina sp. GI1]|uniref:DUF4327 family protein n=1 Tax=Myxosarcina sp. GI1 TaxID=1541065 RepID=UPI00055A7D35|nr:DUF4327 family protein [Myxosarcina sp. GI1]